MFFVEASMFLLYMLFWPFFWLTRSIEKMDREIQLIAGFFLAILLQIGWFGLITYVVIILVTNWSV